MTAAAPMRRIVIAVLCLGVTLALVGLVRGMVELTTGADSDVPSADRIFRLETFIKSDKGGLWSRGSPLPFQDAWLPAGAPIELATRYLPWEVTVNVDSQLSRQVVSFVDPEFGRMFSLGALQGNLDESLARPDTIVLNRTGAMKLFGQAENVLGRVVTINRQALTVSALLPDRPAGSVVNVDMLINIRSKALRPDDWLLTAWDAAYGQNFLRLLPRSRPDQLVQAAEKYYFQTPGYQEASPEERASGKVFEARAVALRDISLHGASSDVTRRTFYGLLLLSGLLAGAAVVNYLNLITIDALDRQRRTTIKLILGASSSAITREFLVEAMAIALASGLLGIALANIAASALSEWLKQPLDRVVGTWTISGLLTILAIVLGVASALYGSWVAQRANPMQVLGGSIDAESTFAIWARKALFVSQLTLSMALVGFAATLLFQVRYLNSTGPGYDPSPLVAIDSPRTADEAVMKRFDEAVKRINGVSATGFSKDVPGRAKLIASSSVRNAAGANFKLLVEPVAEGFFSTYGLAPVAGRLFDSTRDRLGDTDHVVVNEMALIPLGFKSPDAATGQRISYNGRSVEIIGVAPTLRHRGSRQLAQPVLYVLEDPKLQVMTIRTTDPAGLLESLEREWKSLFPDNVMNAAIVSALLRRQYQQDEYLSYMVALAGAVALALAAAGAYVVSEFTVRRRTREFVLNRLYGARPRHLLSLLVSEYLPLMGLAMLVGLPLAAWLSEIILQGQPIRAVMWFWPLSIALVVTIAAACLAGARHTLLALNLVPAQALKS